MNDTMAGPRRSVRFFCTAGNGMEPLLMDEVKRKLAAEDVCQMPGKVLFSSSAVITRVSELKAAERLFLLLKQDLPMKLSGHASPAKAASVLQSRLLSDLNEWSSAVMTWSHLQGELAERRTGVNIPSDSLKGGRKRGSEEQRKEEEKCDEEFRKSTGEQGKKESGNKRSALQGPERTNGDTCGIEAQTLEKKRKRNGEEETSCDNYVEKRRTSEGEIMRQDEKEEKRVAMEFVSCIENRKKGMISAPNHDMDMAEENMEHVKTTKGGDVRLLQPSSDKSNPPLPSSAPVSFRVSCKCTGSLSRYLSIQEVSKIIGTGLSRLLGWKADLRNPQMEVNVYLSDDHCLLGIPLTRLPLANRSYIKTTGLRSTVAWAMASMAQIQSGFCVVDPMCGVGTILIEAAQEYKDVCFLGMDIDDGQLQKANENVVFAELGNRIHLLKASSMVLPLPSASVDVVVCDLPFGRKFGTKANMAANLPLILTEMERVLCSGGTLVLLLSPQMSCLLKKHLAQKGTGPISDEVAEPQTGIEGWPSSPQSSSKQQTLHSTKTVKSSSTHETAPHTDPQHTALPPPLSSLRHQATLRVSLGTIDGLIHKYVKAET